MSEVTDALDALTAGERPLADVEAFFRRRQWPRRVDSGDQPPPGSFSEVADAYSTGQLDHEQYTRLAEAAAAAMKAHDGGSADDDEGGTQ